MDSPERHVQLICTQIHLAAPLLMCGDLTAFIAALELTHVKLLSYLEGG